MSAGLVGGREERAETQAQMRRLGAETTRAAAGLRGEYSGGVRLRDRRLPRHCWQDNEIWDVYGDELGALGISLYATMSRLCYGVRLKAGVREIAEHARMSKSSCARTLELLVAAGLVIRTPGRSALSACTYEMVDVKDLVERRQNGEFPRGTCPTVGQMGGVEDEGEALNLSPIGTDEARAAGTDCTDSGTDVSPNGTPLISKTQDNCKNRHPPTPLASEGEEGSRVSDGLAEAKADPKAWSAARRDAELAMAVVRVRMAHGIQSNPRLDEIIHEAFDAWCRQKPGRTPAQAADLAIANRKAICELRKMGMLSHAPWGWRKWFREGFWADDGAWPVDAKAVNRTREASVGMGMAAR